MKEIGTIDPQRLKEIPPKYRAQHEFCFHLHDLMLQLLQQVDEQRASHIKIEIQSEEDRNLLASGIHILDFLANSGRTELERRAVINHVSCSLYADMLHFIYESLRAFEKRKFTVAFSLLRKPFKESLLIAAQMCADEVTFFDKLKTEAKNLLNRRTLDKTATKTLLAKAIDKCSAAKFTSAESIYDSVFDRANLLGLAGLFDKATHLITENSVIQTEDYNLNFIFKNYEDDDVYEGGTYALIAKVLLFLNAMQLELYSRMRAPNKKYRDWMTITSLGAYEALFVERDRMIKFVNESFKEFLECPFCKSQIALTRPAAARFFIAETLDCEACATAHHFPFAWLLSKMELNLGESSGSTSS